MAIIDAKPAANELSATEIAREVNAGRLTAETVLRASLDRIDAREGEVQAWAHIEPERALATARAFDRAGKGGPLAGVPFGVKDIIDTKDLPTEWGTPIHKGRRAGRDAACVALSRKAGGILLGKTVTTEFANLHPGKTRNPHDPARTPGGSSSGSAAAVADFMAPLAIGTQTTGSTIRPSSFCGVFGYRPTHGEHRLAGVMEAAGSLDTLGICARSIEDVALYRDVLLGIPPEPIADAGGAPRIGFCRGPVWRQVEPATQGLIEDAAERLARAGARVDEIDLPPAFAGLTDAHRWISSFEFVRNLAWEIEHRWDGISDTLRGGRIADGLSCPFERYREACVLAEHCRGQLDAVFGACDLFLSAAALGEAPVGQDAFAGADFYKLWTALGVPTLTLPVLEGPNGLPVGLQLMGRRHDDRRLFAHARWAWRALA